MKDLLLVLALILAILDWAAVGRGSRRIEFFAKPAALSVLFVWLVVSGGLRLPMLWFSVGLLFCIAGDVALMLPEAKFVLGLGAFLTGHILYIIGFNSSGLMFNLPVLILAVLILYINILLYPRLAKGCNARGQSNMRLPVLLYSMVISLMLLSALSTLIRPDWLLVSSAMVSFGAIFFFLSDTMIACNRFMGSDQDPRVFNMIAYHLGQFGIILGAAIQFQLL